MPGKEIRRRREIRQRIGRYRRPFPALKLLTRTVEIALFYNFKCADKRIVTLFRFTGIPVQHPAHGKFHIGLTGTHPYIAYQNIPQISFFPGAVQNAHLIRAARRLLIQEDLPSAVFVRLAGIGSVKEGNGNFPSRFIPSPYMHLLLLL